MNDSRRILVAGATGTTGQPVARALADRGWNVRILSTRPDAAREMFPEPFEVVEGNVTVQRDLERAADGCDAMHLAVSGIARDSSEAAELVGARNAVAVASEQGIGRVSFISGSTISENNRHPYAQAKLAAEQAIEASGVPFTIFRPSWIMESLDRFITNKKAHVLGKFRYPWHWIAGSDFGRMVASAFETDATLGKRLAIHGPGAYTLPEALEVYRLKVDPEVVVRQIPLWQVRALAILSRRKALKRVIPFMKYMGGTPDGGDPSEANELLGAPTTTLEEWCAEQLRRKQTGAQ